MTYCNVPFGISNPGLFIVMIDQSNSMTAPYGTGQKKDIAASAVNRVIFELILRCLPRDSIKDYCYLSVIGYSESVKVLVNGYISEIAENPKQFKHIKIKVLNVSGGLEEEICEERPIWINSDASNGTSMHLAFDAAYEIAKEWINKNPDLFPPVIINITDGKPNFPNETKEAANKLMGLSTSDGNTLIFNAYISNSEDNKIFLPNKYVGSYDQNAKFLFDISSEFPKTMFGFAKNCGLSPKPQSRCFVHNADPKIIIWFLNFGKVGKMR